MRSDWGGVIDCNKRFFSSLSLSLCVCFGVWESSIGRGRWERAQFVASSS